MQEDIVTLLKKQIELPSLSDQEIENVNLEQYGLDSLKSISLILDIEEHFEIEFPDELLSFEHLATVRTICDTVATIIGKGD